MLLVNSVTRCAPFTFIFMLMYQISHAVNLRSAYEHYFEVDFQQTWLLVFLFLLDKREQSISQTNTFHFQSKDIKNSIIRKYVKVARKPVNLLKSNKCSNSWTNSLANYSQFPRLKVPVFQHKSTCTRKMVTLCKTDFVVDQQILQHSCEEFH